MTLKGRTGQRLAAVAAAAAAGTLASRARARHHGPGPVGRWLERWQPTAPVTGLGRAAAYVWAAPVSAAGLLAGAATGTRPRVRDGVVLFAPAGGLTGAVVRRRGFSAAALGHVVLSIDEPTAQLFAHELVHVRQAERLGPLLAPVYLSLLAVHGYRRHPLERAAYRLSAPARSAPPPLS